MRARDLLAGLTAGAASTYFLDPGQGKRRRARARNRLTWAAHELRETSDRLALNFTHRSQGYFARRRADGSGDEPDNEMLVQHVRARLGHMAPRARDIQVEASEGHVRLCGAVQAGETERLLLHISRVPGVKTIDNQLEAKPGLAPAPSSGNKPDTLGSEFVWLVIRRWLQLAVGAAVAWWALREWVDSFSRTDHAQ